MDAGFSFEDGFPCLLDGGAHGGDYSDSCDDDASLHGWWLFRHLKSVKLVDKW